MTSTIVRKTSESIGKAAWIQVLMGLGALLLIGCMFSTYLILPSDLSVGSFTLQGSNHSSEIRQEVSSWTHDYQDLSEGRSRYIAFQDLKTILKHHEDAPRVIQENGLLKQEKNNKLLSVILGALSSHGSPESQQVLSNALQAYRDNEEKAMLVLPQILLLESPQSFLFNELQTFIRKSQSETLHENGELVLAGLWQRANQTNVDLAQKISQWLIVKKAALSGNTESLAHFLDLLGNTANEAFIDDILQALVHEKPEVRERAVFSLRLFKDERAVSALKHQILVEQNSEVRNKAKDALSYFRSYS